MQMTMFDGTKKFVIDKPIRLISTFSGYDSQYLGLKYLKKDVESWRTCEWAVKSIQALKDAHFADDNTDYSQGMTDLEVYEYLYNRGISANYNEPMTFEQIKRLGSVKARAVFNNIKATHNLVNIQQVHGEDLGIVDVDKYCYIMTYSFPCQDLSLAGKGAGMEKGSGTRSGMLWEVERILDEIVTEGGQLPQVLLMENVPEVIGTKNMSNFVQWRDKLEKIGYKCYWEVLNAKDYGVPQNRERCFMVSILGDYYYEFPQAIPLEHRLKDLLEDEVDKKYYLSEKIINFYKENTKRAEKEGNGFRFKPLKDTNVVAKCITTRAGSRMDDNYIESTNNESYITIKGQSYPITKNNENFIEWKRKGFLESDCRAWKDNKVSGTLTTNGKTKIIETLTEPRICASRGRNPNNPSSRKSGEHLEQMIELGPEGVSNTLTTVQKDNYVIEPACGGIGLRSNNKRIHATASKLDPTVDGQYMDIFNQTNKQDISGALLAGMDAHQGNIVYNNYRIRKLTPKECFRLMGVKDEDFEKIAKNQSNASLYHLAGDSIVVDVLMAIFREMFKKEADNESN